MIWAILALLGVPIWLVAGALIGAMASRHRFRSQEDVFPLMFRAAGDDKWPRGLSYGRYVHNVLIVNHGLAQIRTSIHVVEHVEPLEPGDTKHITDPVAFTIRLDDGNEFEIAVDRGSKPVPVLTER